MSHQDSPLSTRPFPSLADLRLQVDERLHEAIKGGAFQGTTRSRSENSRLRWELRAARCELEQGEVEAAWQQEVEFWKAEVSRLEAELLELKQHRASAEALGKGLQKVQPTPPTSQARHEDDASETARWFGRGCGEDDTKKWSPAATTLPQVVSPLSRAERELAQLESEQAKCEAEVEEVERRNAKLRYGLKQNLGLERGQELSSWRRNLGETLLAIPAMNSYSLGNDWK
eukprot:g23539.t1